MRSLAICSIALLMAGLPADGQELSGVVLRAVPAPVKNVDSQSAKARSLRTLIEPGGLRALRPLAGETCVVQTIDCNSTVDSVLQTTDCALNDGTYVDFWEFAGIDGQHVTIDLMSGAFDTFLFLLDPTPEVAMTDDDGGSGSNSRIADFPLDQTGDWTIGANNFAPVIDDPGAYSLSLTCTGPGGTPPAAPSDLTATPMSSTEIQLGWQDNSNNEDEFRIEVRQSGGTFADIGSVPANSTAVDVTNLQPETTYDFRARARNSAGDSPYSNQATATTPASGPTNPCVPSPTNMCLNDGRFKVEVQWVDFQQNTGSGTVVPFGSDDSGLFWFFKSDNWEMLVKVIDACDGFDHFWVFAAATTNVEYTLTVEDTEHAVMREYHNPLGLSSPAITDTNTFATCP